MAEREKHKSYDVRFKLRAVEVAKKKSIASTSREFGVDRKRIREWMKQEHELTKMKKEGRSKSKRLKGAGRRPHDEDMEESLFDWIIDLRQRNLRVSRVMILRQARVLSTNDSFKGSIGWLNGFLKRKGLSLRRKTTVCQNPPEACVRKLVDFIMRLRRLQLSEKFSKNYIFAMDETACWFNMPSDTTIDVTGAKSVSVKTTGHEKNHFTVVLTAKADRTKMKPFIVFKGKGTRLMKDLGTIPGVVVKFSSNGWMNETLTIEYLRTILGSLSFGKRLMVWDAYRCHMSEAVKSECARLKLQTSVVPGGCTKFIQAADVAWNGPFKSHMRSSYDTWLSEPSCHEYTKSGNTKAPSRSLFCNWVKSAWDSIPTDLIANSFLSCAITTSNDGSDDDHIHCFKENQPCAAGRQLLLEEMQELGEASSNLSDPFASDTDNDEMEENEVCIENDSVREEELDSNADSNIEDDE